MYTPEQLLRTFLQTFDGASVTLFRGFLQAHQYVTKWIIASDFALHDPSRPFDCFCFTVIPYDKWSLDMESDIKISLPKDFKKSKDLSNDGVRWLRDRKRFHIALTFNKDRAVFFNGDEESELEVARKSIDLSIHAFQELKNFHALKKAKKLQQYAKSNRFNTKLFSDIWLLCMLYASISVLLCRERRSLIVGLFPDRDNMSNYCDGIWLDLTHNLVGHYCELLDVDMRHTRLVGGGPDRSGSKEVMWFDYMIRPADWFAGAIASWDRESNKLPGAHEKYRQIIESVVADADNMTLIHGNMDRNGLQFRRIAVSRSSAGSEAGHDNIAPS